MEAEKPMKLIAAVVMSMMLLAARQPQLTATPDMIWMTYVEEGKVYARSSVHGAGRWSKPLLVATPDQVMSGSGRGPRIAASGGAVVVSAVSGGNLLAWRSTDGGATWSQALKVNDVDLSAREGLHAMAAGGGKIYAAWLDLREPGMKLYGSVSSDGGATWSKNELLYRSPEGGICECCYPTLLVDEKGGAMVMFRNNLAGNRDMYVMPWGGKAAKLGMESWLLNACPMDGGTMVWEAPGKLLTAWRRDQQVFLARPGAKEEVLGNGRQPVLVKTNEGVWAAWTEGKTLWLREPDGARRKISESARYVSAVARPWGGITLAWEGAKGDEWLDVILPQELPAAPAGRTEILSVLEREMYGKSPEKPRKQGFELREKSEQALGGKAIRKQVSLWYEAPNGKREKIEVLLYLPKTNKKVPVFAGMSFGGNECANSDENIFASTRWQRAPVQRGGCASRWEVEYVVSRGYGTAIVYYGDLDPDFDDGYENGVHAVYGKPKADEWGSVAAWAWGMSRVMDYLEQDPQVDAKHVAVHGHSRIGKAALWAGAVDERFAMVISNNSGEGGAAVSRRLAGERTRDLNRNFPHWFAANFKKYSDHESEMPFDSHWVLKATAPRLLYVTSASEDLWADPEGEFEGIIAAGMKRREMLKPGERYYDGRFAYHLRQGPHDIQKWDWEGFMDFADLHHWRGQ
jgi:hypothetical protein